jgi:hypothetical protein
MAGPIVSKTEAEIEYQPKQKVRFMDIPYTLAPGSMAYTQLSGDVLAVDRKPTLARHILAFNIRNRSFGELVTYGWQSNLSNNATQVSEAIKFVNRSYHNIESLKRNYSHSLNNEVAGLDSEKIMEDMEMEAKRLESYVKNAGGIGIIFQFPKSNRRVMITRSLFDESAGGN